MRFYFLLFVSSLMFVSYAKSPKKDSLYIEGLRNEGIELAKNGNLIGSIERIEFAITEARLAKLPEQYINERLRDFLANRYSNIGDFDRAIELTKGLESFFKQNGDLENELETKTNLGVYNQNIGRHIVAYNYFFEGWKIQKDTDELEDKIDWLDGLSATCIELGKFKDAKNYLEEAESLLEICPSELKQVLLPYYYVNQSNYSLAIEDDAQAEFFLLKCVSLAEKTNDRKGADAYLSLAKLSLKQNKNQQGLVYAKKIITLLGADKDPLIKDPYLLQSYAIQAKAFLALSNYEEALLNCNKAENQSILFQQQYLFNESKLHIGELRRENLETGIMALYSQYKYSGKKQYLEQALIYANRAKSNVLNERLTSSKLLFSNANKDAVSLRIKLIFRLNECKKEEGDSEVIILRNKLDSLNQVLGLQGQTPFVLKDLKKFQSSLKEESICIEYMVVDTLIFRFDIQRNKIEWSTELLKNPAVIFDFYDILRTPGSTIQEFVNASSKLPVLLPFDLLENSNIQEINVIPDGVLNYVVFDVIPSSIKSGGWNNIHYLAEDYLFSYQFSMQSFGSQLERSAVNYLGLAPDYDKLKKWANLKNSTETLEQAQGYFGGKSYFGIEATKKNLQQFGPNADILHLYTHGVSNDSSYDASHIILQDGELHVDEILALPLKSRLCLLTACEVGLGKEYKGEGITSVAWAFKAAGAENVIQSIWKLNEQSSYQLMNYFFTHLAKGTNSSESLIKAKRQYLASSDISDRLKHPYYWAGIMHYGEGAVFTQKTQDWWKFGLVGVFLFLISFILVKYKKKDSNF